MIFKKTLSIASLLALLLIGSAAEAKERKRLSFNGAELLVSIKDDLSGKRSVTEHQLKHNGRLYKLRFRSKAPEGLFSGQKVRVRGEQLNAHALLTGADSGSFTVLSGTLPSNISGVRQVVALRIQSLTAVSAATDAQIASALREMDRWYLETSFQMLSIKNDLDGNGVPDIYTVSVAQNTAGMGEDKTFSLCSAAQSAAQQLGISTSAYNHVICILPPDMNYSWWGTAWMPGREVVVNGKYAGGYPGGYTHELGHNIGMAHANTPGAEYGESACIMGGNAGTAARHFNGPHKNQMAWLPLTSAAPGSYDLSAVELPPELRPSQYSVLKLRDAIGARDLYISYRSPYGTLTAGLNSPYRTSIHTYRGGAQPTVLIAALGDGETFSQNGISVTQVAHYSNHSATILIGANCAAATPSLSVSPANVASNTGAPFPLSLTLKNNDVNCAAADFSLSATLPPLWSAAFANGTLSLAAGQSQTISVTVTPPTGLLSGSYQLTLGAAAAGHQTVSANAAYALDIDPPAAVLTLSARIDRKNKVTLSWSAPADTGSGIARYLVYRNNLLVGSTTATQYVESPGSGTFSYYLIAEDKAGSQSAAGNTVSVTLSNGKPGRK